MGTASRLLLQERDLALIEDIWHYRWLTTSQIETLRRSDPRPKMRFVSRLPLTRRLKLLFQHRYVQRLHRPAARGSLEPAYVLDAMGAKALRKRHGEVAARSPSQLPKTVALDHLLAVNQVRVALTAACRLHQREPQIELVEWLYNDAVKFSVASFHASSQVSSQAGERSHPALLIPDAFFALRVPPQRLFYFVEVDLGTEPAKTLVGKCRSYVRYWQSGGFARDFGVPLQIGFRTVFIAPTPARLATIAQVIRNLDQGRSMFWVTMHEHMQPDEILLPVFRGAAMHEGTVVMHEETAGERYSLMG